MHKEKSRGSGCGSRKTQVGRHGWVTRVKVQPRQSRENGSARLLRPRHGARSGKEEASLEPPAKGISRGLGLSCRSRGFEPRLGVEPWLDGSAWLSYGSHSIERKVGKCLRLD
ncbi:hypothetical protein CRG98_023466 [Punica granatum]|uniref:Uncharacterized protein n=1 Tax=Punica granatum TaxID=22663 RepID=A0A2I0JIQ9_PUNGR|nr:hypothetical protein CRG98_023466 [Punica granatum]